MTGEPSIADDDQYCLNAASYTDYLLATSLRMPVCVSVRLSPQKLKKTRSLAIAKSPCDCCIILKSGSYAKAI